MDTPPIQTAMTKREMLSPYKEGLPSIFHRVARRGTNWELPRRFRNYRASSQHEMSMAGAATKCFLSAEGVPEAYIAKFGHKNGEIETYTELFNNHLGKVLGFEMAHSGVAKLDGVLHFLSRSFRAEGETLIHGSLMVEQLGLAKEEEMVHVKTIHQQQGIYDVEFVENVIQAFCGTDCESVFKKFVKMLIFDALIGSMDRHPRNWGVIRSSKNPGEFRFSPIYDSARALFWDFTDARLGSILDNEVELRRYVNKSSPRIGLPGSTHRCNHFELVSHVTKNHKPLIIEALDEIPSCAIGLASDLLHRWPFGDVFTRARRNAILSIISLRLGTLQDLIRSGR